MRSAVQHVLSAALFGGAIVVLSACAESRAPQTPASDPKPQKAFNDPSPQRPNDPVADNLRPNQQNPFNDPLPQASTFGSGGSQTPFNDPKPQKPFMGSSSSESSSVLAKTDRPLSDAEVATVAVAANDGEVQMAEFAIKKATAADVKQFAGMMRTHHTAASQKAKAIQTKAKLGTASSDLSSHLENDANATIKELRDADPSTFDRTYMSSQVKAHKDVLAAIDNRLTPSATNGELKAFIGEMRRTVSDHLAKAEDIQKKLDGTASVKGQASDQVGIGTPSAKEPPKTSDTTKKDVPKAAKPEAPPNATH